MKKTKKTKIKQNKKIKTEFLLTGSRQRLSIQCMRVDCEQSLRMVTRARKSSEASEASQASQASESKKQEADALSSPAAPRLDWLKRDCSQSSMRGTSETIYGTYTTTLQYTCCTQTYNHFTTTAYLCQGHATARLLTSVKPARTLARVWPNTNECRKMVTSTIAL